MEPREDRSKNESVVGAAATAAAAGGAAVLVMWRSREADPVVDPRLVLGDGDSFHEEGAITRSRRCSIVWLMEEAEVLPLFHQKKKILQIIQPIYVVHCATL